MAYYLDSLTPASTRYATIPAVTFAGDFEIKVIAAQLGTSPTFIFAGSGVAGQNGIDLYRTTSGNYQLFINASSAISTTTPVTNSITSPDTVIVRRLSGVVDLIINGVSRGTFSTSATLSVERLFHRNGWANYGRMGLYEFTIVGGGSYNTSWNASNSPSGGSTWTSSGGQVMTQAGSWPADNSEWIFYSSGLAPYLLSVTGVLNKYVACNIPQPAIDTGRALQVEYEDEFEVRRTATDWPLVSTSVSASNDLIFLRTGSNVEIRSTGNSTWTVTTGVDLTQFHVFRLRTAFDGTTITRQLYVDGALKGTTTSLSNARMGAMAAFFGLANDATRSGEFKYFKRTDFVNSANSREYNAGASGGIGNIIPELLYSLHGTQQGTWPSNDSEWISYGSGSTSWEGTIGKTSLSAVNKSLSINTGQVLSPDKTTLTLSTKQQSISTGFVVTNGKTSLTLSPKQEAINVGYINTLSKLGLALLQKQLSITVGANLPFTGVIGKTTYALNGKQLGLALGWSGGVNKRNLSPITKQLNIAAGWSSGVVKSTLPVSNKQESVLAGFVNTINEINIPVNGKPLNLQTGTSISYIGTINKGSLNVSGKPLDVVTGTAIPFVGLMQKTSLTLTGKQLGVVRGQVLDLQKQALNIVGKQLSLGEIVYPIVPIERIFTIKDGDRIHYFKQTTTVYVMKNN